MFRLTAVISGLLTLFSGQLFGQVSLSYETDFETIDGYADNAYITLSPWVVGDSLAQITSTDFVSDAQSVLLHAGIEHFLSAGFSEGVAGEVAFVDFYLKPYAGAVEDLPESASNLTSAMTAFVYEEDVGRVYVVYGDGIGGGDWIRISRDFSLDGKSTQNWIRFTYRLNYATKTWDLYLDDDLVATDITFVDDILESLSQFRIGGGGLAPVYFDFFYAGYENPIFLDSDQDGMSDSYETANNLDYLSDDRYGDQDFDGIPNIHEYLRDLEAGNPDTDGDGIHDGWELATGADPLTADLYDLNSVPFVEDFEGHTDWRITTLNGWKYVGQSEPVVFSYDVSEGNLSAMIVGGETEPTQLYNLFQSAPGQTVWVDFSLKTGALDSVPTLGAMTSSGFYFSPSGHLMAFDGASLPVGEWVELGHEPVALGQWRRITTKLDYANQSWSLYLDSKRVAEDLGFANPVPYFTSFALLEQPNRASFLDAVTIGFQEPADLDDDGDGLSNSEEDSNGNGSVDPGETDPNLKDTDGDGIEDRLATRLHLWLSADYGISSGAAGEVSSWQGLVGSVSQATTESQPLLQADAIAGLPAVSFDGANDFLSGTLSFNPNEDDITIVMVQRRVGGHDKAASISFSTETSSNGAPLLRYGPEANQFGINNVGVGPEGVYVTLDEGYQGAFYITSVRRSGGTQGNGANLSLRLLKDMQTHVSDGTQTWNSIGNGQFTLGQRRPGNTHYFGGDIAEVYVYQGSLSDADLKTLEDSLAERYDILIDGDADGLLDEWEFNTFASLDYGSADDPDQDGVSNWREYNLGTDANSADSFDFITANADLRLWLSANQGLTLQGSQLAAWQDISGNAHSALQSAPLKQPVVTNASPEGVRFVRFDGSDDYLEGESNFDPGAGDFTLIAVTSQRAENGLASTFSYSTSDAAIGAPLLRWNRPETGDLGINEVGVSTEGAFVALPEASRQALTIVSARRSGGTGAGQGGTLNVRALSNVMTLESEAVQSWASGPSDSFYVGRKKYSDAGNNDRFSGDIAEIIAFDSALSDEALLEIELYLADKYDITLDLDADGLADEVELLYFSDLSQGPEDDSDLDGLSNARELNLGLNPAVADNTNPILQLNALVGWFDASHGVTFDPSQLIAEWTDRSGYLLTLEQLSSDSRPVLNSDTLNSLPVVSFDGINDFIDGDIGFNPGASDFTVFAVHRRTGGHEKAATWSFNTPTGSVGAPLLRWGPNANQLGINAVGSGPEGAYVDLSSEYLDRFFLSTVSRAGGANGLDGVLKVFSEGYIGQFNAEAVQSWTSSDSSLLSLGLKSHHADHYFGGDIAELIIFEGDLSLEDRSIVEGYLIDKYNLSSDRDGDGLLNSEEDSNLNGIVDAGETDANSADTDGDGMSDAIEPLFGYDPTIADNFFDATDQPDDSLEWSVSFEIDEGFVTGPIAGQTSWADQSTAVVSNLQAAEGQQSLSITGDEAMDFISASWIGSQAISISFKAKLIPAVFPENYNPSNPVSAVFGIDYDNYFVAWDASQSIWVRSAEPVLHRGAWFDFEVNIDYENKRWNLIVDDEVLFWGLPFDDINLPNFSRLVMRNLAGTAADQTAYIDSITLSNGVPFGLDFDGDGLDNELEQYLGSDLYSADSDSDGMPDGWEYENGLQVTLDDSEGDLDGDLLWNLDEYTLGLNPNLDDLEQLQNSIIAEVWYNLEGSSIENLTSDPDFPKSPDRKRVLSEVDYFGESSESKYGQRIRGLLRAPVSGEYTFWISGNDKADLWLSPNADPFQKELLARVSVNSKYLNWEHDELQRSYSVSLEANQEYYFEVLHKQRVNANHVSVAWEYAGQELQIIPAEYLNQYSLHPNDLDDDSLPDDWETSIGLDSVLGYAQHGFWGDADGDGLLNYLEYIHGTNPFDSDSDNDGYDDWSEVFERNTDPSTPEQVDWQTVYTIPIEDMNPLVGIWSTEGNLLRNLSINGEIELPFTLAQAGVTQLLFDVSVIDESEINDSIYLHVFADEEYIGYLERNIETQGELDSWLLTPYLQAGSHTIRVLVENVHAERSVLISPVVVQQPVFVDDDARISWNTDMVLSRSSLDQTDISSKVSPAVVEGKSPYTSTLSYGQESEVIPSTTGRWYCNIPLQADGGTTVDFVLENSGASQTAIISWEAFNILDGEDIVIRQGDALKLTALSESNESGLISIAINGLVEPQVSEYLIHEFTESGDFTVLGTWSGSTESESNTITVKVLPPLTEIDPVALWNGRFRYVDWPVLTDDYTIEAGEIYTTVEEYEEDEFSLTTKIVGTKKYYLNRGLVARVGDDDLIAGSVPVENFWVRSVVNRKLAVVKLSDDSYLVSNEIFIGNLPDTVELRIKIYKAGVSFEDGTRERILTKNDFDQYGIYSFKMIMPPYVLGSACHRVHAYQDGIFLGER